jgi:hypothetical protein
MNDGAIFLLREGEKLVEMREQKYESEDLLQRLLAENPELLAGEQMDRNIARRWVLVRREAGVPGALMASDRWSMDHLFLDQDGVPTIVEVKRSSDTRLRREVVGQMLDYAANAVVNWPAERIRMMFEETCKATNADPVATVLKLLRGEAKIEFEDDGAVEQFWKDVERNFQARHIRMVFVADEIPRELQTIVEFLNGQMKPSEVLAVEVKQYMGEGARTLVPRVYGLTAEAQATKRSPSPTIDEAALLDGLDSDYAAALQRFFDFCRSQDLKIFWGAVGCSIRTSARERRSLISIAWVNPPGRSGWAGLTDVTLGVDQGSVEYYSSHLLNDIRRYVAQVAAIEGAGEVQKSGMLAYSFTPAAFIQALPQICKAITDAKTYLGTPPDIVG